jgi:16S rRNA (cytosine1402-N4)-methyltransferase
MSYHQPVMLSESMQALDIKPDGVYVDLTYGGGGHAREIMKALKKGKLIAFDQDPDVRPDISDKDRFYFFRANYRFLSHFLCFLEIEAVDGIFADLGVSWHQFDEPERGFTFRSDGPLDMRMSLYGDRSAAHLVNTLSEEQLRTIFREYGELREAGSIARAIVKARGVRPIQTTAELNKCLEGLIPAHLANRFLARVYQALRMEVNQEQKCLAEMLEQTPRWIKPGGRLVIISYHSLEDRMVKHFIRAGNVRGEVVKDLYGNPVAPFRSIGSHAVKPTEEEIAANPRARSAKLRTGERI